MHSTPAIARAPSPLPAGRGAVRPLALQLRLAALVTRADLVLLCGVGALLHARAVAATSTSPAHSLADRVVGETLVFFCLALYWAAALWRDERPGRRLYLASLPVEPRRLQLARVGAGWILLVLAFALVQGTGVLVGAALGRAAEFRAVSPLAWVAALLALSMVYLFGSAAALLSRRPGRWLTAAVALLLLPQAWHVVHDTAPGAPYGGQWWPTGAAIRPIAEATLDTTLSGFGPGAWAPGLLAWLAVSLALVFWAAGRAPD
ncbi:MAG TPA: hypothetical protein VM890_04550 [Longimicrobium sp.]|nr:hypothetical protein [Longimicrobium sp.]